MNTTSHDSLFKWKPIVNVSEKNRIEYVKEKKSRMYNHVFTKRLCYQELSDIDAFAKLHIDNG